MIAKILPGYEGGLAVGQRKVAVFTATGPTSYNTSTGDVLTFTPFPYLDYVESQVSISKLYEVHFFPSIAGPRATWSAKWIQISTGLEVASATNLSTESIIGLAYGGDF